MNEEEARSVTVRPDREVSSRDRAARSRPVARLGALTVHRQRSLVLHRLRRSRGTMDAISLDALRAVVRRHRGCRHRERSERRNVEAIRTLVRDDDRRAARARLDRNRMSLEPSAQHRGLLHQLRASLLPNVAHASEPGHGGRDEPTRAPSESFRALAAAPSAGTTSDVGSLRLPRARKVDVARGIRRSLRPMARRSPGVALTR